MGRPFGFCGVEGLSEVSGRLDEGLLVYWDGDEGGMFMLAWVGGVFVEDD